MLNLSSQNSRVSPALVFHSCHRIVGGSLGWHLTSGKNWTVYISLQKLGPVLFTFRVIKNVFLGYGISLGGITYISSVINCESFLWTAWWGRGLGQQWLLNVFFLCVSVGLFKLKGKWSFLSLTHLSFSRKLHEVVVFNFNLERKAGNTEWKFFYSFSLSKGNTKC